MRLAFKKDKSDPDQQAVYYAERVAFDGTLFADPLHSDDFMRLADRLFTHDWWVRHNLPVPIIEPTTREDKTSYAWIHQWDPHKDPIIKIAPTDINAWVLSHEAAHVAVYGFYNVKTYGLHESHGREFRATYLSVAEIMLGKDAALSLRDNFDRFVAVRPKHAPGMPGSILCVPKPRAEHDPSGMGIFPTWRLERQKALMDAWNARPVVSSTPRINGAIAL